MSLIDGELTPKVYDALLKFDRLTIDDIVTEFSVTRGEAGYAVMRLLERDDVITVGAGIRRLG